MNPPPFFFNGTATNDIYTLSLHDALPISLRLQRRSRSLPPLRISARIISARGPWRDRKSTRLNSSHSQISYAVFCLKKKIQPIAAPRRTLRSQSIWPRPPHRWPLRIGLGG